MDAAFLCGRDEIRLTAPEDAIVYESRFPGPEGSAEELVERAVEGPLGAPPLHEALKARRAGDVAVVVSDVTRPIPYSAFLPRLLARIESAGVRRDDVLIIIATGMHRPSTPEERSAMFGPEVAGSYRIVDHVADDESGLAELPRTSWSGNVVRLNRRFAEAGFRFVTGLVEPHFMAGFSGGPKAVCPGLSSLDTVRRFHGWEFLADERAASGVLEGNPCHEEALSVARLAGVDYSLNVVLDGRRRMVRAFAGDLEEAHRAACDFVRACACPRVAELADVALTSSGGHPLDATFYQCVKGMVSCLPAVREGACVVSFGGCAEGIGSPEFAVLLARYAGRWREFLDDIRRPGAFTRDQWQFQMHCRALARVGRDGLHFVTDGLSGEALARLPVRGHAVAHGRVGETVQSLLGGLLDGGARVAVFPEGPYCAPVVAGAPASSAPVLRSSSATEGDEAAPAAEAG